MKLDDFTRAYIECALWASTDDKDEPLDRNYGVDDIAPETLALMVDECARFQADNAVHLVGYPMEHAGHDFWLTRCGHGAGYWENDFGTPAACEALTNAAHAAGNVDLYVGDDGKLWL